MSREDTVYNPLDGYEHWLKSQKIPHARIDAENLVLDMDGQQGFYQLEMFWQNDDNALHLQCAMEFALPEYTRELMGPVLMHINRHNWLGHFELTEDGRPLFRYTLLFFETGAHPDAEALNELTDIAVRACDKHLPAFRLVSESENGAFPRLFNYDGSFEPLGLALLDTAGNS